MAKAATQSMPLTLSSEKRVLGEAEHSHEIWRQANFIKNISDRIIGIGPFGIGLDGVLSWVPAVGTIYSLGAGAFLLGQAIRAKASGNTVARMIGYIGANTATSTIPVVGWAVDTLFRGHLMAATALQKDIEDRHGAPPEIPLKQTTRKENPAADRDVGATYPPHDNRGRC